MRTYKRQNLGGKHSAGIRIQLQMNFCRNKVMSPRSLQFLRDLPQLRLHADLLVPTRAFDRSRGMYALLYSTKEATE
jgi:hypothetical protein